LKTTTDIREVQAKAGDAALNDDNVQLVKQKRIYKTNQKDSVRTTTHSRRMY